MTGRPQGGMKSEVGRAAYWRMKFESAQGALADLIAEHRALVEAVEALGTCTNGQNGHTECADCRANGGHGISIADVRALVEENHG